MERGLRAAWRIVAPEGLDEVVSRHDRVPSHQKHREHHALLRATRCDIATVLDDSEWTKQSKVQGQ